MGKYRVEIIGSGENAIINVEGCKSIEKYTREKITISLSNMSFTVFGHNLSMPVLVDSNLKICGYVRGTEINPMGKDGKNERLL